MAGTSRRNIGDHRKILIHECSPPTTVTELHIFFGLMQFIRRFIKDFSKIASPLTNVTRKHSRMSDCDAKFHSAFWQLKHSLASSRVIQASEWNVPFCCHTYSSQLYVAGTLTQLGKHGEEHFFILLKAFLSAEKNYSANDREILGLVYSL